MIYTLGNKATYDQGIASKEAMGRRLVKVRGGSVWETREAAQGYLDAWREQYGPPRPYDHTTSSPHLFAVYGVEASWDADTVIEDGVPYRSLRRDAPVVRLDEEAP
jgi:hypothetical protein